MAKTAGAEEYTRNECRGYNTKQSHGLALVVLEFWGMQSTPSLPSLPS